MINIELENVRKKQFTFQSAVSSCGVAFAFFNERHMTKNRSLCNRPRTL